MSRIVNAAKRLAAQALVGAVLVAALAGPAAARPGKPGKPARPNPNSPFNLKAVTTTLLNGNEWSCGLDNLGDICVNPAGSSVGGGGWWPQGTQNQYIFNTGLQAGAIIGPDGGGLAGDTVADHFFDAYGAFNSGVPITNIFLSSDPNDLASWPQDCYLTNPATGQQVKTLGQFDTCVEYWDADPQTGFKDHPMGLKVVQHSLEWSYSTNKDIIFFIFTFTNATNDPGFAARVPGVPAGGYTLTDMYAAFGADADVSAAEYDDNYATVVADQNMAVQWQADFETSDYVPYPPNFDAAPGFVGFKFLAGPPNTADTAIVQHVGFKVDTVQPGQPLGMSFFSINTNGGAFPDPDNSHQAYRYLSGHLGKNEAEACALYPDGTRIPGVCYVEMAASADTRTIQSSGPFTLKPGESAQIVAAYVVGAPVPGTYVKGQYISQQLFGTLEDTARAIEKTMGRDYTQPGFPSLFANASNAQAIFNAGFILPGAPPSPNVTVIPGDHQNTVIWDASPVDAADPYYQIASQPDINGQPNALYNPAYREHDFEGFRIYRKTSPTDPWVPIAEYDTNNGVAEQVTPLTKALNLNGDTIVISADTARVCPEGTATQLGLGGNFAGCTPNNGLKFAIVDKGGAFPDPSSGPGLVNGHSYYYAVTSFDINSPFSGPSSLESARVLSNESSGVPRANAAGFVAANISAPTLMGGGKALDPKASVTIDPSTGTFSGPQPVSNGLNINLDVYDPAAIPQGDFSVKIDSVIPINDPYFTGQPGSGGITFIGGHTMTTAGNGLAAATIFYTTVSTPDTSYDVRTEVESPFGYYTAYEANVDIANAPVTGTGTSHYAGNLHAWFDYGAQIYNSGSEAVGWLRAGQWPDGSGGSRWFSDTPEANPTLAEGAGSLPGVDSIVNLASQYGGDSSLRWQLYLMSTVYHAADYEITWGDAGSISQVTDLSNNVDVPFSPVYRGGTWGFLPDASGDGILSFGDFWGISPLAEWYCGTPADDPGCFPGVRLTQTAKIMPISAAPPSGYDLDTSGSDGTGFGLYIGGEEYLFKTSALPASGTKWVLRTYEGQVARAADGTYSFSPNKLRSPIVPGLSAQVSVASAAKVDLATADLSNIHTVPDPYYVTNSLETSQLQKKLMFVNLPPQAIIRIYSLSGTLVAVVKHDDPSGGGQEFWDLRSRNNQYVASGVYFYHVEVPGSNKTKVGKFTVIQYAQ